jgi:hypothetical protein
MPYLYSNRNPHGTPCQECAQYIGWIFPYSPRPSLPRHAHCYCYYQWTKLDPTWPGTEPNEPPAPPGPPPPAPEPPAPPAPPGEPEPPPTPEDPILPPDDPTLPPSPIDPFPVPGVP